MKLGIDTHPHLASRVRVQVRDRDVTNRVRSVDDHTGEIVLLCGDMEAHRDWKATGSAHLMPDADDRPCELRVRFEPSDVTVEITS